jgi:hypothetical protein
MVAKRSADRQAAGSILGRWKFGASIHLAVSRPAVKGTEFWSDMRNIGSLFLSSIV